MSRINRTLVVNETGSVDLNVNTEPVNVTNDVKTDEIKTIRDVPPNTIYGHNLKKISS